MRREDDSERQTRAAAVMRLQEFVFRAALTDHVRTPASAWHALSMLAAPMMTARLSCQWLRSMPIPSRHIQRCYSLDIMPSDYMNDCGQLGNASHVEQPRRCRWQKVWAFQIAQRL